MMMKLMLYYYNQLDQKMECWSKSTRLIVVANRWNDRCNHVTTPRLTTTIWVLLRLMTLATSLTTPLSNVANL